MATVRRTISTDNTTAAAHGIACVVLLLACTLVPQAVFAQAPPPGVFSEIQTAVVPRTAPALEPATMRSRVVQVDTQKITAARRGREILKLNLFDDAVVEVQIKRVRPTRSGYFISGTPKGMEWGEVRLVVNGPVMVGTILTPEGKFTIRSGGAGRHVIRQIDPMAEPFICDVEEGPLPAPPTQAISSLGPPPLLAAPPTPQADDMPTEDGSEIRILIVYTPALQAAQGGAAGMRALIDLFVQSANQAFEESGINPRLVLAHAAMVDYVAQGTLTDLSRLRRPSDGYMDEVHSLRNEHAADLVHLLTNVAFGAEGRAGPLGSETLVSENYAAFAVTANSQEQTFTHEVGHNFGVMHDRYSFGSTYPRTIYPYAFGYVNPRAFESGAPDTAKWRTIMSTQDRCRDEGISCPRLLRFSNPDQSYMDDPLGVSAESTVSGPDGPADARTTINNTARWVGSFRSEACTTFSVRLETPFAPVGGGEVILKVDAAPGCLWEAASQADFLTISSGARHAGTAFVNVEVKANPTNAERIGSLTVAGTDIMIRQLATADGVCGRTPAVTQAITRAAGHDDASQCDQVTADLLAGITSLELQSKAISSLKAGDLEGLSGLVTLELYNNRLNKLPEGVFSGLSSLEELSLSINVLTELPEELFAGLSSLRDLKLAHNRLTELPEGVFSGLSKLEYLEISSNQLNELPEGLFSGLSGLQILGLGSNQLADLPAGPFAGLSGLQELLLSYNQLTDLAEGVFSGLSKLEHLDISSNQLYELPEGLFSGLSNLKTLYLSANRLSEMRQGTFATLHNLQQLYLGFNQLTDLQRGPFDGLSNLQILSLERNNLESLPDAVFSGLTSLYSLNLRSNNIDPLPVPVWLRMDADNAITANVPTGAPFALELPISVSEAGTLEGDASIITVSVGRVESESVSVIRQADTQDPVTLDLAMPSLPADHFGYVLQKAETLPLRVLPSLLPGDAALTDLSVSSGTLNPPFAEDETNYGVVVANSVSTITVTPITSNSSARVAFFDANDGTLADADSTTQGHQASLVEGENTIKVHVTSEDGMSTQSYTLVAVRDGTANVCVRTPQVRDAIMKASGIGTCTEVSTSNLSEIIQLDLNNKDVSSVSSGDFAGLTALDYLDLRFNRLGSLPAGVFSGLTALQTLNLYDNHLTNLSADVFSGLTALQRLSLGSNRMTALPDGLFLELTSLRSLGLGTNRLSKLPDSALSKLSALEILDLRHNRFKRMLPHWFSGLPSLQTLSLNGNQLSELPGDMFSRLNSLQVLDLGDNLLTRLPADVFAGLTKLETLTLSENRISKLPADLFSGLSALQWLQLSENQLSSLPVGIFSGLSALKLLQVQRNTVDPLILSVSLEKMGSNQFKAVAPVGAPFNLEVSLSINGPGTIDGEVSAVTIPAGAVESAPLRVSRVAGTEDAVALDIAFLPGLPENHAGYSFARGESLPRVILPGPKQPSPAQVTAVQVTPGAEQLEVSWTVVTDASGYKVQWKSGDESYDESRQAVLVGGDTVSYTITGLTAGTEFTVRVLAAKENADDGLPSSEVTGTPSVLPASQVTGVEVARGVEQLDVSWDALSDTNGYKVQWKSGDEDYGEERQAVLTGGETVSHTITDLTAGTEYTVRVIATREDSDDGTPSSDVAGIPKASPASQVTGVEITVGVGQLAVTWTAVSDASGYKVQWKSGGEDYAESRQALVSGGDTVSHTLTGLTVGTEYTVRVIATSEHAEDGDPSSEAIGTPKAEPPAQVTGVEVESGPEQLEVSWAAVSDAGGYKVQWKSGTEAYDEARQAVIASGDTVSHTITGLTSDTEYTIRVIATKDNADDGTPSDEVTATPISADPDVNGDGVLDGDDALAIYHSYGSAAQLGDGETGGTAESRQSLLAGYSGQTSPSDDDLKAMIRKANAWKAAGVGAGGDINEDGVIDESDAFVMYYAYTTANLVGDGETGGTARFRELLLAAFANKDNPTDEDLKKMLRRANKLRDDFG